MKTVVKITLLVAFFSALSFATYCVHGFPKVGIDDANIFFSYSENLASGHGITYAHNPERVEGFTSMLWMLVCGLIFYLGLNEFAVLVMAILLLSLSQWIVLEQIKRFALSKLQQAWPYQLVYLTLIACSPSYITWMTITLMDTCLWGLIVAAMTCVVLSPPMTKRGQMVATLPFALAPMVRPEGMLVVPALLSLIWMRSRLAGLPSQARFFMLAACCAFVTVAALTAFRLLYFGYPVPSTYYAKVSPSLVYDLQQGRKYLNEFVLSGALVGGLVALVLYAGATCVGRSMDKYRSCRLTSSPFVSNIKPYEVTAIVSLILLVVPVLTGGDHFRMFRFFQPAYPILVITLVLLLLERKALDYKESSKLSIFYKRDAFQFVMVAVVLAYWIFAYPSETSWNSLRWSSPLVHEFRIAENGVAEGVALKKLFDTRGEYPAVGVITAGGIARTYPGLIVDLMGLNNKFIAHFKGDRKGMKNHSAFEREAFFHVEPDILLASPPVPPATNNLYSIWLKGLLDDQRFTGTWRYGVLARRDDPAHPKEAFYKKAFLDTLSLSGGVEFRDTMIWSNKWVEVVGF